MVLTVYQTQFKWRMKCAISLRAKADRKARSYTKLLSDAIGAAEDAAMQMNELNQIYGVDVSTYTLLTQVLDANSGQEVLKEYLAQSASGEEAVVFNLIPDGNGGQPLPANPLFGELVAGTYVLTLSSTVFVVEEAPRSDSDVAG
jgi:hypothetical protein